jgi:hypothetical protein
MFNNHEPHDHDHDHSVQSELLCHFPYAVFSVTVGLALLSLLGAIMMNDLDFTLIKKSAHMLFHSFHFMHIAFAATGTVITYLRFSTNVGRALLIGLVSPTIFCILSDTVLPYCVGRLFGVNMHFHVCFYSELPNVLPFLAIGIITGFVMSRNSSNKHSMYALSSHAMHIFVSSLAATFYLVAHGFTHWHTQIGMVFLALIIAVVIPCTLSDVVVPMLFAKADAKK